MFSFPLCICHLSLLRSVWLFSLSESGLLGRTPPPQSLPISLPLFSMGDILWEWEWLFFNHMIAKIVPEWVLPVQYSPSFKQIGPTGWILWAPEQAAPNSLFSQLQYDKEWKGFTQERVKENSIKLCVLARVTLLLRIMKSQFQGLG